jgi:hypothetical protein
MRWMMLSLAAAAFALTGCASMSGESRSDIDYVKVANIENAARAVGVSVYWFNYPTKSTASLN